MFVKLCVNQSSENTINKILTNELVLDLTFRKDLDVSEPILLLGELEGVNYSSFNYCVIDGLGRKYFIREVSKVNNGLTKLVLVTDVLETYKESVLNAESKYKRKLELGDQQDISVNGSLKTESVFYSGTKTIVLGESLILSTIGA